MSLKNKLASLIYGSEESNQKYRDEWIEQQLKSIPAGKSILDAGAGEMPYKRFCSHLKYMSQDFCKYTGGGGLPIWSSNGKMGYERNRYCRRHNKYSG